MLHPDSHNMFENGSFLRRRRRFKLETSNHHQRHRQKAQRTSPNLISPNNLPDSRPNGTKASRSRAQMEKDSESDDLEPPPKKVGRE